MTTPHDTPDSWAVLMEQKNAIIADLRAQLAGVIERAAKVCESFPRGAAYAGEEFAIAIRSLTPEPTEPVAQPEPFDNAGIANFKWPRKVIASGSTSDAQDAARYRAIRKMLHWYRQNFVCAESVDAAIDAARGKL